MVTRARAPPHLSFQILSLLPAELPLFHGLGVTIIIEVEQDDREMRQLSHYSFDGGYHGGTVRWSPSPRYSWMVHLNISKVFSGRYMVMSLFERSRRLSRPTLPMIFKMKYR